MEIIPANTQDYSHPVAPRSTPTLSEAEEAIKTIMRYIGDNPDREGLRGTPERIVRMWSEIFRGYDSARKPKITTFTNEDECGGMILDSGDYYSMCEHHMLPFFGRYCFAYIPAKGGRILGISKIARVVGYCAARLQLQERLAEQVVGMLSEALGECEGMIILMRGTHLCKTMRGARNDGKMSVIHATGCFLHDAERRAEFLRLAQAEI